MKPASPALKQRSALAPRRKPRQSRSAATVDAILEAAAELFARDGFEGVSTTRIAERAGVSVGSLYEYFPNKDALAAKLLKRHCDRMIEDFATCFQAAQGSAVTEVITLFIESTYEAYAGNARLHRVLLEQMGRVSKPYHMKRVSLAIAALLEQALINCGTAIRRPSAHLAAFMVESAVEALTHRALMFDPELFEGELRVELAAMILGYIRTTESGLVQARDVNPPREMG